MVNIKVFSDFTCPFCYIGFSIANRLRKENPNVNIEWFPYLLDPNSPLEGSDITEKLAKEQLDQGYKRIQRLGSEYGLVYNNKTKSFNTNRLHKAALYAQREGRYYEFAEQAFKTIFEYGKNVADPVVLNEIGLAAEISITEMNRCIDDGAFDEQVEEAKIQASAYEIESVPTFIVEENKKITTLKDYERFKKDLLG